MGHVIIFGAVLVVAGLVFYPLLNKLVNKLKKFKEKVENNE